MRAHARLCALTLAAGFFVASAAPARADDQKPEDQHAEDHEPTEHHGHQHHIGVFLGITQEEGENFETVGVEYVYRFRKARRLAAGVLLERVGGEFDAQVAAGLLFVYPWRGLRFVTGPGIERRDGHDDFLVRAGIAYQFTITQTVSLSPEWNVDFFRETSDRVIGLTAGFAF